jgi:hypothetical protein
MNRSEYINSPSKKVRLKSIEIDTFFDVTPINNTIIPRGYHTAIEYADMVKVSERTIQRRLKRLWKLGKIKIEFYYTKSILNHKIRTPYYMVDKISLLK